MAYLAVLVSGHYYLLVKGAGIHLVQEAKVEVMKVGLDACSEKEERRTTVSDNFTVLPFQKARSALLRHGGDVMAGRANLVN